MNAFYYTFFSQIVHDVVQIPEVILYANRFSSANPLSDLVVVIMAIEFDT